MKRTFLFLLLVFASADVFAGNCCHTTVYDEAEKMTKNCGSLDDTHAPQNVYIQNGKVAFLPFPNVRRCDRGARGSYKLNPSETRLCSGFSSSYATGSNRSRFDPVPDHAGQCWRWQCKSAYGIMASGGQCLTPQENCAKLGLEFRNNMCSPKWCAGYESGFNAGRHYEYQVGNCYQYRCIGSTFFNGTDKTTCKHCSPEQGLKGGCYGNTGAGTVNATTWTYVQCTASQYVNKVGNSWTCTNISVTDDARIKSCWKCKDFAAMQSCIKSGNGLGANTAACP
jgi:hypothetical protein